MENIKNLVKSTTHLLVTGCFKEETGTKYKLWYPAFNLAISHQILRADYNIK